MGWPFRLGWKKRLGKSNLKKTNKRIDPISIYNKSKFDIILRKYKVTNKISNYIDMKTRKFQINIKDSIPDINKKRSFTESQTKEIYTLFNRAKIIMQASDFNSCAIIESENFYINKQLL